MAVEPDARTVRAVLSYDPDSGIFRRAGRIVGSPSGHGYLKIGLGGRQYYAHRLAWLIMTGEWPPQEVDHKNRKRGDNRWGNLRLATKSQNLANSKTKRHGLKGIHYAKHASKWRAEITCGGKRKKLGYFATAELAHAAYCSAAKEFFGEFANSGLVNG